MAVCSERKTTAFGFTAFVIGGVEFDWENLFKIESDCQSRKLCFAFRGKNEKMALQMRMRKHNHLHHNTLEIWTHKILWVLCKRSVKAKWIETKTWIKTHKTVPNMATNENEMQ